MAALLHGAVAQYANNPFFEHTKPLAFAYGAEMIGIRLAALTAIGDPPEDFLEETEKTLTRDLPRFMGSLEAQDASLAQQLEAALGEVLETQDEDAIERARDLSQQAQDLLVPAELQRDPAFVGALMAKLLLADDGVAEGYEDAAEGDIWEYPNGWAALQRVKEMWEEVRPTAPEEIQFEIDDMLQFIDELYPSPVPPDEFRGDPEEAEAPAHRIVGFLEETTDAFLYPGRDLGQLAGLTHRLVQGGCEAYEGGQARIGVERVTAANFYYREYLRRLVDLLAPELHENATNLFGQLLAEDAEPEAATAQCQELLETLGEAQEMLGG
jgi:hypothetical protein